MVLEQRVYPRYRETPRSGEERLQPRLSETAMQPLPSRRRFPARGGAWEPCPCPSLRPCRILRLLLQVTSESTYSETHFASAVLLVLLGRLLVSPSFGIRRHKTALGPSPSLSELWSAEHP